MHAPAMDREAAASNEAETGAAGSRRRRPERRGPKRFGPVACGAGREPPRALLRRPAEGGPEADRARAAARAPVAGGPPKPGGILSALRRSPPVGAGPDFLRPRVEGRRVDP